MGWFNTAHHTSYYQMSKSSKTNFQSLFEEAPIGIYRANLNGRIITANKALISMLGFSDLQSLKEFHISDFFVDTTKYIEEQRLLELEGKVKSFEFQLRRIDGKIICVRDTLHIVRDETDKSIFYDGVIEDVTERVQAKNALVESRSRIEAERAQRQLAETLREIATLISGSLEFENVTKRIFKNLKRLIPFDHAELILRNENHFFVVADDNLPNPSQTQELPLKPKDDLILKQIIKTKQPFLLHNASEDPRFNQQSKATAIKSWLGVPLIAREQVIGILSLESATPNTYRPREIQIALTLAFQIAVALENARLFEEERQRADIMSALQRTLADITAELDLKTLLQSILERATSLLNAVGGELALYDPSKEFVTIVACHNMTKDFTGSIMHPGKGAIGKVVVSGEPLIITDYKKWDGHLSKAESWPWKGVIAVPLKIRDHILGVIALADSKEKRIFDQTDLRVLTLFAHQASIAIENAQLFDLITSALTNTATLYQTARALIETENLSDIFNNLIEQVANGLTAKRVILITLEIDQQRITNYIVGGDQTFSPTPADYQELMDGLTGWVIREGKPALSISSELDPREKPYVQEKRQASQCGSLIVVPLLYRQQVLGTLTAINSISEREYTQADVDLLETIASHAAVAIKNAQLFEEIQHLAKTDDLTGINNRRQLFTLGNRELNRAKRYQHPFTVIMLDIDNFKEVNDTYGHAIGDEALKSLAKLCQINIRKIDILGRYGGEEFVILLPNTNLYQGNEIADRLRVQVEDTTINTDAGEIKITISLGLAQMDSSTPTLAALIDRADTALYQAKNTGRNRVEINGNLINSKTNPSTYEMI